MYKHGDNDMKFVYTSIKEETLLIQISYCVFIVCFPTDVCCNVFVLFYQTYTVMTDGTECCNYEPHIDLLTKCINLYMYFKHDSQ